MVEVEGDPVAAARVLATFGDERPSEHRALAIGLTGGAQQLTAVVRALDEAGIVVQHMELNAPTLDDVFAEATGRRLEGAADGTDAAAGEVAPA